VEQFLQIQMLVVLHLVHYNVNQFIQNIVVLDITGILTGFASALPSGGSISSIFTLTFFHWVLYSQNTQ
jgi:hypothetical protein